MLEVSLERSPSEKAFEHHGTQQDSISDRGSERM